MSQTPSLPGRLQQLLQRIYDVEIPHGVDEFLITDRRLAHQLGGRATATKVKETLLVSTADDGLDLALYLDAGMLAALRERNPLVSLHDGNLQEFWTALEGVSHFLYLVWNAGYDKPVSLLELELQAEVDKFIGTLFLLHQQHAGRVPAGLHRWLFEKYRLVEGLDATAQRRYRHANGYAREYCERLQKRFLRGFARRGFLAELRRFYRLGQRAKLQHIGAAAAV